MRYFLVFSYCGTNYHGWQRQPNSLTIQQIIEEAISTILKQKISLVAAGRTDAGVHATNMYAHFDANINIEIESKLVSLLNSFLDYSISIKKIIKVVQNAHARFDAISRTYKYKILFFKDPFKNERYFEIRNDLNFDKIKIASANRFLRNMVRAIVGTLIEVGKNKISIDNFNNIIIQRDRKKAGFSVPACGLYLVNVEYPEHIFL